MGKFQRKPAGAQLSDRKSEEINKSPDIASQIRLLRVAGKKKNRKKKTCKLSTSQEWARDQ